MRRNITPREIVSKQFESLEHLFRRIEKDHPSDDRISFFGEKLSEFGDFLKTMIIEAPPADPVKFAEFLESASPERFETYLSNYIFRQVQHSGIVDVDAHLLTASCLNEMKTAFAANTAREASLLIEETDQDSLNGILEGAAKAAMTGYGREQETEFNAYLLEQILREAVGLDGRKTEPEGKVVSPKHVVSAMERISHPKPQSAPEP